MVLSSLATFEMTESLSLIGYPQACRLVFRLSVDRVKHS